MLQLRMKDVRPYRYLDLCSRRRLFLEELFNKISFETACLKFGVISEAQIVQVRFFKGSLTKGRICQANSPIMSIGEALFQHVFRFSKILINSASGHGLH